MANNPTTNFGFDKPTVGGNDGSWGQLLNDGFDTADAAIQDALDLKAALAGATFTGAVEVSSGGLTISGGGVTISSGGLTVSGGATAIHNRLYQLSTRTSEGTNNTVNPDLSDGNVFIQTMASNSAVNFGAISGGSPGTSGLQVAYVFITAHSGGNAITSSGGAVTVGMPAAFGADSISLIRLIVASNHTVYEYVGEVA